MPNPINAMRSTVRPLRVSLQSEAYSLPCHRPRLPEPTMTYSSITYRVLTENPDLEAAAKLEAEIWGWDVQFASPTNVMRVTALKGGLVLCVYDGEAMIGMSWAFPVRTGGVWALWSHVAGVLTAYRGQGIGAGLKFAQRDWALANGYEQIRWTFDPMQAGNANFNLRVLGATAPKITENMYGIYDDDLNPGLPTDRFEALWRLTDPRVVSLANGQALPSVEMPPSTLLAYTNGTLQRGELDLSQPARVEIPAQFFVLGRDNPTLARDWQTALRETLTHAFAHGFAATDFIRDGGQCWYVLTRLGV